MSFEELLLEDLGAPVKNAIVGGPFGSNLVSKDYVDDGVPVIRGQNMGGKWVSGDFVFVSSEKAGQLQQNKARPGDLVFTQRGTLGQVSIVPAQPYAEYIVSQSQMKITLDPKKADVRFIYYLFRSELQLRYIFNSAIQTGVPHTNLGILRKTPVIVPPLSVQKAIAEVLSTLDDRITLLRETNVALEAIAQALFKSWFVDFDPVRAKAEGLEPQAMDAPTAALFPDSFEESELGLLPKGWKVLPFLDVCDLQGGAQPPASTFIDEPRDGYVRLLQIRDFSTDAHKTYIPDTKKLKKVTEDDVLIGRYGSASGDKAKDSLGRVCRGLSGSYNVALMKLSPVQVGKEFAFQLVSDAGFYGYLQGVSSKAVQSGFSKSELGQYKVVVPPRELAEQFEQFGEVIWKSVKENRKQAQTLSHLRDTLLPRLISGQLRLPEAEVLLEEAV